MKMLSIELVPRSLESLEADTALVRRLSPSTNILNIPDLLRFSIRSWDACVHCSGKGFTAIPHLRAMDFSLSKVDLLVDLLAQRSLNKVLVVRGDPPTDLSHVVHPTSSSELIRALKRSAPQLEIYAAFDPYRQGLLSEIETAHEKLEAGASGFFTQPIFDLRLADLCADLLPKVQTFWGVSPVISEGSKSYWQVRNRAFFPPGFRLSMEWNWDFAKDFLLWAESREVSAYIMPLRVNLEKYLSGLLS